VKDRANDVECVGEEEEEEASKEPSTLLSFPLCLTASSLLIETVVDEIVREGVDVTNDSVECVKEDDDDEVRKELSARSAWTS